MPSPPFVATRPQLRQPTRAVPATAATLIAMVAIKPRAVAGGGPQQHLLNLPPFLWRFLALTVVFQPSTNNRDSSSNISSNCNSTSFSSRRRRAFSKPMLQQPVRPSLQCRLNFSRPICPHSRESAKHSRLPSPGYNLLHLLLLPLRRLPPLFLALLPRRNNNTSPSFR